MPSKKQSTLKSKLSKESKLPETSQDIRLPRFRGEWDDEGVYVYQAYNSELAEYAVLHQRLGGPDWNPVRMTWIKPSFGWMLYRSGYGMKSGQNRILKVKLSHESLAILLSHCQLSHHGESSSSSSRRKDKRHNSETEAIKSNGEPRHSIGTSRGRVQWDPERDLDHPKGGHGKRLEPRRMMRTRAIQIGLSGDLSKFYVDSILSIEDVTDLAHSVRAVHSLEKEKDRMIAMKALRSELPLEREYLPDLSEPKLRALGMLPGEAATMINQIGLGNIKLK